MALSDYTNLVKVGTGGHSTVYKAQCQTSGECVAIKKVSSSNVAREIKVLQSITSHENVVRFVNAFEEKGHMYVVLEYVDNDLGSLLRNMRTPLLEVCVPVPACAKGP